MRKIIRNILAYTLCGVLFVSSCGTTKPAEGDSINSSDDEEFETSFSYPSDYEKVEPTKGTVYVENDEDFEGNVGDVTIESGDIYALIDIKEYGTIKIKLFPEGAPYAVQNFIDLANSGYYTGKSIHRVIGQFMMQGGSLNGDGTGGDDSNGGSFNNEINTKLRHFYGALCYASAMGENSCQFYIVNSNEPATPVEDYSMYSEYYLSMAQQYKDMQGSYDVTSAEYGIINQYIAYYTEASKGLKTMLESTDDTVKEKYNKGGVPFLDGGYTVFGQTVEGFEIIDEISKVKTTTGSDGAESKPIDEILIDSVTIMIAE